MEECSCLASFLPSPVPLFLILRSIRPTCGVVKRTLSLTTLPVQLSDLTNLLANPGGAEGRRFEYSASISVSGMPGASSCCLDGQAVFRRSLRQSDIPRFQAPRNPLHSSPLLFSVDCSLGIRRACGRGTEIAAEDAVAAVRESPPANAAAAAAPVANGKCRRGERSAFSSNCRGGRR